VPSARDQTLSYFDSNYLVDTSRPGTSFSDVRDLLRKWEVGLTSRLGGPGAKVSH
jgi:hypothetical protein